MADNLPDWFAQLSPQEQAETVQAARLLKSLHGNKAAYPLLKQAVKAANPNVSFSEDNLAAPYVARLDAIEKTVTDGFKSLKDERENAALQAQLGSMQERHGFADKVMDEVKALMVERGIADPEAAALLYEKEHPAPQAPASSSWGQASLLNAVDESDELKDWIANEDAACDREVGRALDEIKSGKLRPGYV